MAQLRPELADRLQASGEAQLVEDLDEALGTGVLPLLQLASRVREGTGIALGLGVLLLLGSVALAPKRRRALLGGGGISHRRIGT